MTGVRFDHLGPLESPFAEVAEAAGNRQPAEVEGLPAGWPDAAAGEAESLAARRREECARNWKKLRDSLPEAMTKALDAGEWIDAARWGIQNGMRDVGQLTDVIFWQWFGDSRGYCKLERGEPRFDYYADQWKQIRDQHVRPAFTDIRPLDQAGPVPCVEHDRHPAGLEPDNPPLDITGRYEDQRARPLFTLRVNQAGRHVECVMAESVLPVPGSDRDPRLRPGPRRVTRFSGDLQHPESKPYFELYDREKPTPPVLISTDPGTGALQITDTGARTTYHAALVNRSSTLLEGALAGLDKTDLVRLYEQRPLARHQIQHLQRSLRPGALAPLLRNFFDVSGDNTSDRAQRSAANSPLVEYLEKVWDDPDHGIEKQDRELARFYARTILTRGKLTLNYESSLLDWLQLLFDRLHFDNVAGGGSAPTADNALTRLLGLSPRALGTLGNGGDRHTYQVSIWMEGGGLFAVGYVGKLTIEKVAGDFGNAWKKGQPEHFHFWLAGMDGGGGLTLGSTIEAEVTTPFMWQPPDFPGTIGIAKLEVGAYGASGAAGFVHIHGQGNLPTLQLIFDELGRKPKIPLPHIEEPEAKFELGLAGYLGKVRDKPFPKIDYTTFTVKTDYAVTYNLANQVHFCLDSGTLSALARHAIRVMCANELAAFGSPASHLTILGHTDRVGNTKDNLELSQLRADNTLVAIRGVLGTRFGIPDGNIVSRGEGEKEVTKAGLLARTPCPMYRRVDIVLNGRLVLTLSAQ